MVGLRLAPRPPLPPGQDGRQPGGRLRGRVPAPAAHRGGGGAPKGDAPLHHRPARRVLLRPLALRHARAQHARPPARGRPRRRDHRHLRVPRLPTKNAFQRPAAAPEGAAGGGKGKAAAADKAAAAALPSGSAFACSLGKPAFFQVGPTLPAPAFPAPPNGDPWEGVLLKVPVKFEPTALGTVSDVLTLDGGEAGTYYCTLTGVCTRPEPQGPFLIALGEKKAIEIRNVFNEPKNFTFHLDSPDFDLNAPAATIGPRSTHTALCTFNPKQPPTAPVLAKLAVSCDANGEALKWTYYLRGQPKQ